MNPVFTGASFFWHVVFIKTILCWKSSMLVQSLFKTCYFNLNLIRQSHFFFCNIISCFNAEISKCTAAECYLHNVIHDRELNYSHKTRVACLCIGKQRFHESCENHTAPPRRLSCLADKTCKSNLWLTDNTTSKNSFCSPSKAKRTHKHITLLKLDVRI